MKKVLMMLAVVGFMAVPLFADIDANTIPGTQESGLSTLVYNVKSSMKGWDFHDANATVAEEDKIKVNAFVVFDVNDTTLVTSPQVDISDVNLADPNVLQSLNNTTLILLGSTSSIKKAFAIVRNDAFDEDEDINSVTMELATVDHPIFGNFDKSKETVVDAFFEASGNLFDIFTATSMFGKLKSTSLDKDEKIMLPKSLSACGEVHTFDAVNGFEEDDVTGTIKLTLNTSYTKNVDDFTVFKATTFVANDLVSKGYTQVTIEQLITSE